MHKELLPFDREDMEPDRLRRMIVSAEQRAGITKPTNKEVYTMSKKTGKRSAAVAIILAAAFLVAAVAGAVGIGYIANHKDVIDNYFGGGVGDRIEQQGLYESVEVGSTEHFRIMKEAALSTGRLNVVIITAEATDQEGREYIARYADSTPEVAYAFESFEEQWYYYKDVDDYLEGKSNALESNYADSIGTPFIAFVGSDITEAFGDNLFSWTIKPKFGDGYMTFEYIFELGKEPGAVTVPLELYLMDPETGATDLSGGQYLCTVEFSTESGAAGRQFVSETTGRAVTLYDFALYSDRDLMLFEAVSSDPASADFSIVLEYADGSSDTLTKADTDLVSYYDNRPEEEQIDEYGLYKPDFSGPNGEQVGVDTRVVLNRFVNSQNVEAIVINGERFAAE